MVTLKNRKRRYYYYFHSSGGCISLGIVLFLAVQIVLWNTLNNHPTNHQSNVHKHHVQSILYGFQQQQQQMTKNANINKQQYHSSSHSNVSNWWWNATHTLPPLQQEDLEHKLSSNNSIVAQQQQSLSSLSLPMWFHSYIQWHQQQRNKLNETNWMQQQYLILICPQQNNNKSCGGLSDRFKSIPLLLQLSELYQRIFLIYWEQPISLEYFVVPTESFNWCLPYFMKQHTTRLTTTTTSQNQSPYYYHRVSDLLLGLHTNQNASILYVTLHDQHGGSSLYNTIEEYRQQHVPTSKIRSHLVSMNTNTNTTTTTTTKRYFHATFRSIWWILFVPSIHLVHEIQKRQQMLKLSSNSSYVVAHVRALYHSTTHTISFHQQYTYAIHAWQCAQTLRSTKQEPIVLLSDSIPVLQTLLNDQQQIKNNNNITTTTIMNHSTIPKDHNNNDFSNLRITLHSGIHLDQTQQQQQQQRQQHYSYHVQDYMDTFVDLYIMANAHCITHGPGGFGRLGVLLSQNASCFFKYYQAGKIISCES